MQSAKAQSYRRQTVQLSYFYEDLYLLEDLQRMNQTLPVLRATVHPAGAAKKRDPITRVTDHCKSQRFCKSNARNCEVVGDW